MELNSENFTSIIESKERPVAVMVKASWCSKCKALTPVFEKTAKELEGKADFHYLTVDDNQSLAKSLKIMGVPTLLFYRHGVLISKKLGVQSAIIINKVVEPLINISPEEAIDKEYRSLFRRLFGRK